MCIDIVVRTHTQTREARLLSAGAKAREIEFTQCRTSFAVKPSARKTCPKWAPQLPQTISVRTPSSSGMRFTAPGISSSKLGQPQLALNLSSERYSAALQRLQTYVPFSQESSYLPLKGCSVPLWMMTSSSSLVNSLYFVCSHLLRCSHSRVFSLFYSVLTLSNFPIMPISSPCVHWCAHTRKVDKKWLNEGFTIFH